MNSNTPAGTLEDGLKLDQNMLLKIAAAVVVLIIVIAATRYQLNVNAAAAESNDLAELTETSDAAETIEDAEQALPEKDKIQDSTRFLPVDMQIDDVGVGAEILPIPREYKIAKIKDRLIELGLENQLVVGVNIATQTAWVYKDGQIIWESPVVTAWNDIGFETPVGIYDVYNKIEKHSLFRGYKCDYWVGFNQDWAEGFHDAQWRQDWSNQAYKYDGSGGCVNVPLEAMQQLFDLLNVGDIVWVHDYKDQL